MGLFSKKQRLSEAQFPQAAVELAQRLADSRESVFESCVEAFEEPGVEILNRNLDQQTKLELTGFQLIHSQRALGEHRYLDEAGTNTFLQNLLVASCPVRDDDVPKCADFLLKTADYITSLYLQEEANPNKEMSLLRGEGVLGTMSDCLGCAILGALEWQTADIATRMSRLAATSHATNALMLWAYWHAAVTFNDEKELQRLEKEMQ